MHRVEYLLWLKHMGLSSSSKFLDAIEYFSSPEELYNADKEAYEESSMFTEKEIEYLINKDASFAKEELARCNSSRTYLVDYYSKYYPPLLRELPDPPLILYVTGSREALLSPSVTIVGSRNADAYGITVAQDLSSAFSQKGYAVVSGMAEGIDSAVAVGTVNAGGKCVGVLCCGMDIEYPSGSSSLREKIISSGGAIITEFEFGTNALPGYIPKRNRILAGLSSLTAVVEASEKSGALITAKHALSYSRRVASVPGNITNITSKGCNTLIENGAEMILDVLEYVKNYDEPVGKEAHDVPEKEEFPKIKPSSKKAVSEGNTESENMMELLKILKENGPLMPDELTVKSGRSLKWVNSTLIILEISGKVKSLPGNRFSAV